MFARRKAVRSLREYVPFLGRCRILLFGPSGAGKSSLVNNLKSDSQNVCRDAIVRFDGFGQCTLEYQEYVINDKVSIFDTWGWDTCVQETFGVGPNAKKPNYTKRDFISILRGMVPDEHKIEDDIIQNIHNQVDSRIIDAVGFVLCAADVKDNSDLIKKMKKYIEIAKSMNVAIFFAVTRVDSWFQFLKRGNLLTFQKASQALREIVGSEEWKKLQIQVQENIGDDTNSIPVFPIVNYSQYAYSPIPVITLFKEEFTNVLTRHIDRFYMNVARQEREEFGGGTDSFRNKGSRFLFQGEKDVELVYQPKVDPSVMQTATFIDGGQEERFVVYERYYRVLKIGRSRWRFLLIDSKVTGCCQLVGVYNPVLNVYLESINADKSIGLMKKSFDVNKFVPKYCFLDERGNNPMEQYDKSKVVYLRISLYMGKVLRLKKVRKTPFHSVVFRLIHDKKLLDEMNKELSERLVEVERESKKKCEEMQNQVNGLKELVYQILGGRIPPNYHHLFEMVSSNKKRGSNT